jgi:TfoX/Sxy family transcriptional regulator of competence genes
MAKETIAELESLLTTATDSLPKVTSKKMFGCHAVWAGENVFALVWKQGRIGVKLPDAPSYAQLLELPGAIPWKAGPMQMAHWVLVPESFHAKKAELKKWASKAHSQCLTLEKEPKKKTAKKVAPAKSKKKVK